MLIEAYPGSERIASSNGAWPLHYACFQNNVAVVEYLYHLYPDAINHATTEGHFPIHFAIDGTKHRDNPAAAVDVVKYLLGCDPNVKLQKIEGTNSSLCVACAVRLLLSWNTMPVAISEDMSTASLVVVVVVVTMVVE